MSDLTDALTEADKWFERGIALMVDERHPVVSAARRVADAPEVWWCEEHDASGSSGACLFAFAARLEDVHCRMVRKLLVDPAEENP